MCGKKIKIVIYINYYQHLLKRTPNCKNKVRMQEFPYKKKEQNSFIKKYEL